MLFRSRINEDAYRQAVGLPPRDHLEVDQQRNARHQGDARERGSAAGGREAPVLTADHSAEAGQPQHTQTRLRITDASQVRADVAGKVVEITDTHVLVQTGRTDAVRFTRAQLSGEVHVGKSVELEYRANERKQAQDQSPEQDSTKQLDQGRQQEPARQNTPKRSIDGL